MRSVSGTDEGATHSALGGSGQDVRQLDRLVHLRELSGRAFAFADRRGEHRFDDRGLKTLGGARHEDLALLVVLVDHARVGARQLRRPCDDCGEHGLEIQRRTDGLADLAQRP